jgi:hypothetical protein
MLTFPLAGFPHVGIGGRPFSQICDALETSEPAPSRFFHSSYPAYDLLFQVACESA